MLDDTQGSRSTGLENISIGYVTVRRPLAEENLRSCALSEALARVGGQE